MTEYALAEFRLRDALRTSSPGTVAFDFISQSSGRCLIVGRNCPVVSDALPDAGTDGLTRLLAARNNAWSDGSGGMPYAGYLTYEAGGLLESAMQIGTSNGASYARVVSLQNAAINQVPCAAESSKNQSVSLTQSLQNPLISDLESCGEFDQRSYCETVRRIQEDILAGEYYELNFTQRFRCISSAPPGQVASILRRALNPNYWAYMDFGDLIVVSASPELFLSRRGNILTTKPIKGSVGRGENPAEDEDRISWLRADSKNAAEHTMVVDLARNDLGRVCRFGSVRIQDHAAVKTYPAIHHLVSTVSGEVVPGTDLLKTFEATFPAASITGAPKIRVMHAIQKYERSPRGIYTGACGFSLSVTDYDWNVAIRTLTARPLPDGMFAYEFGAGGAIVADSVPEEEYQECLMKALPLFRAIKVVEQS